MRAWTKLCKKTTVLWCEFKRFRFRIQNSPLLFSAYVMLIILQIVGPIQLIFKFHSVLDQNIHYLNDESHKIVAYYYDSLKMAYSVFVFISLRSFLPSHSHFFSLPLSAPPLQWNYENPFMVFISCKLYLNPVAPRSQSTVLQSPCTHNPVGTLLEGADRQYAQSAGQKQQWPPPPSAPWHLCYAHTHTHTHTHPFCHGSEVPT